MNITSRFFSRRAKASSPRPERQRDEGFLVPLALVLTVVFGAMVIAIASYSTVTLREGTVVRTRVQELAASDGGARIALEKLRTKTATCPSAVTTTYTGTINSRAVTVTCQRTALLASDIAPFALVVTGDGVPAGSPSFIAQGTNVSTQPRAIGGNVYLATPPPSLDKPVAVTDGDLWYYSSDNSCVDPTYGNLTFKPADERGYSCTTNTWQSMFPQPPLPSASGQVQSATGKTNSKGCTIFSPGTYQKPPVIGAGTQNFFQPGTYYFDFNTDIQVKNALVIGGITTGKGHGSSTVSRTDTTFTSPWCASAIAAAANGGNPETGITWIFGRGSRLSVDPNGQVELFAPAPLSGNQIMAPTVVALESDSNGYKANTNSPVTSPLIDMQEGSSNGVVIHGGVWAPGSGINLGNIAQAANGQFMGGIVVGLMNMQTAASVGNFNMSVATSPATKRVIVKSTSGSTTTTVVALVRAATGSLATQSWRVK